MKWSNLVSLTLLSYLISMSVHAQPTGAPVPGNAQQPSTPAADTMTIEDSGGSLKIAPKTQQPSVNPQAPPDMTMPTPPSGAPGQQPPADSVDMNPNPPQGELQEPSNTNQNMVPAGPQQNSMPDPAKGSMQN